MPPKKKVLATATQPRKMAKKVKPDTITDEAWAHKQARCRHVTEDPQSALNARHTANSATTYAT
jgi:hypothetical protein